MARLKLREFQEYLAKRLSSAARGETAYALLGIQSGPERWLLNLADSGEILPMPPLAPVPLTHSWFAGMANIRGNLYSVVDFSAFRGGDPTPRTAQARLVLIGSNFGVNSAILVNRMLGLKAVDVFEPADDYIELPWVSGIVADNEGNRWHRLNVPDLLADPKFMQIGI
jgi:twitching motility protein PilI